MPQVQPRSTNVGTPNRLARFISKDFTSGLCLGPTRIKISRRYNDISFLSVDDFRPRLNHGVFYIHLDGTVSPSNQNGALAIPSIISPLIGLAISTQSPYPWTTIEIL